MSRPRFEKEQDRINEERIIRALCEKHDGFSYKKIPDRYYVDYLIFKNKKPYAFCEVKKRYIDKSEHSTFMISLQKIQHGIALAEIAKIKFILIVEWNDMLGFLKVDKCAINYAEAGYGGRKDRKDKDDLEPVIYFPINRFSPVA